MARQRHVVAVPCPAQGHLNPLMRFSQLLASHGVLVTFVNIDPVHHRLKEVQRQLHQQALGDDDIEAGQQLLCQKAAGVEETLIRHAHIPIHGFDLANNFCVSFELFCEAQSSIAPHLETLILQLNQQGPPVSCIVSDVCMTFPTQSVADKLNIPRIGLFPSSASFLLLYYYAIQGERISTSKVLEALARRVERQEVVCEGLPGLPTIFNNEVPQYKHVVDDTQYLWNFIQKSCQRSFQGARAIAINSFEDLEAPALMALSKYLSLPIYGVGPLVKPFHKESSPSLWIEDEACLLWLDQQPPLSVLYISFGSITLLSQPQFEEIVAGLFSSQQRFLWALRSDLVKNVDNSTTFMSVSDSVLSRSHPGRSYVVEWAPQSQVLAHPSTGGFLTHCGWNSTMEAIAHGVPMLCWPYFGDQHLDAKFVVEEWKVGLQFKASKEDACLVERGEVERVINVLMQASEEGKMLRENAMHLKEAGLQSQVGTSHRNVQALISSFM